MLSPELFELLLCPSCGSALRDKDQVLECTECKKQYPVTDGIPDLLVDDPKGRK